MRSSAWYREFGKVKRIDFHEWVILALIPISMLGAFAAGAFIVLLHDRKMRPACDRVVERLLTTHDPVELERSRILVNQLDCSVSSRIPK